MAQNNKNFINGNVLSAEDLNNLKSAFVNDAITLFPKIEQGFINSSGEMVGTYYGKQYYRTPKFLKPVFNNIALATSEACEIQILQYDINFNYIKSSDWLGTDEDQLFILEDSCIYI